MAGDRERVRAGVADLQDLIDEAQGPATTGAPPASPSPSLAIEISELAALHEAGALSAEEFAAAKAKLIGG